MESPKSVRRMPPKNLGLPELNRAKREWHSKPSVSELKQAIRHTEQNPVKAFLVRTAREWPWSSARHRDEYGCLPKQGAWGRGFQPASKLESGRTHGPADLVGVRPVKRRESRARARSTAQSLRPAQPSRRALRPSPYFAQKPTKDVSLARSDRTSAGIGWRVWLTMTYAPGAGSAGRSRSPLEDKKFKQQPKTEHEKITYRRPGGHGGHDLVRARG